MIQLGILKEIEDYREKQEAVSPAASPGQVPLPPSPFLLFLSTYLPFFLFAFNFPLISHIGSQQPQLLDSLFYRAWRIYQSLLYSLCIESCVLHGPTMKTTYTLDGPTCPSRTGCQSSYNGSTASGTWWWRGAGVSGRGH